MPRIEPVHPPYEPAVGRRLETMMPPGVAPIRLFRTFVRNLPMTNAMTGWGTYELSPELSLTMREREIVIDRTCARCRCEYEWGVHVKFFATKVGLTGEQLTSLAQGGPDDPCWQQPRERLLVRAVDSFHETADLGDALWAALANEFDEAQLLDLVFLCGWYHAISYAANAARVEPEDGAPRFADAATPAKGGRDDG